MASSLSVGLPHQEVSSQLPLDSCLTPAVQTIRDVPTEGGLARTDPPSPRALPPWHRRASGEEVSQTAGPGQARRLQPLPREEGRPEAVGSHNLSPRPCPHHHCTLQGSASSGAWERWAVDTTRSHLPPLHSPAATTLPWQPPGPLRRRH